MQRWCDEQPSSNSSCGYWILDVQITFIPIRATLCIFSVVVLDVSIFNMAHAAGTDAGIMPKPLLYSIHSTVPLLHFFTPSISRPTTYILLPACAGVGGCFKLCLCAYTSFCFPALVEGLRHFDCCMPLSVVLYCQMGGGVEVLLFRVHLLSGGSVLFYCFRRCPAMFCVFGTGAFLPLFLLFCIPAHAFLWCDTF